MWTFQCDKYLFFLKNWPYREEIVPRLSTTVSAFLVFFPQGYPQGLLWPSRALPRVGEGLGQGPLMGPQATVNVGRC